MQENKYTRLHKGTVLIVCRNKKIEEKQFKITLKKFGDLVTHVFDSSYERAIIIDGNYRFLFRTSINESARGYRFVAVYLDSEVNLPINVYHNLICSLCSTDRKEPLRIINLEERSIDYKEFIDEEYCYKNKVEKNILTKK